MKKKYIVLPNYIHSKHDFDQHYIGAGQLMRLYGVNRLECVVYCLDHPIPQRYKNLIKLYPRYDGNYNLNEEF